MKKTLLIGWKDVLLIFRDKAALILMLAAPLAMTFGMGLVTGRFTGSSSSAVSDIPVVVVNQDSGTLGNALVEVLQSADLADLLDTRVATDAAGARQQVDDDTVAAAIVIPAGFSDSIIPQTSAPTGPAVSISLFTNPTRPTSAGVVKALVEGFVHQIEVGRVGAQVIVSQLLREGLIQAQDASSLAAQVGASQATTARSSSSIELRSVASNGGAVKFDILAYMAPGMALLFLMYAVTAGGRALLTERAQGTLPRLLVTPTSTVQVLGGKALGIFLSGLAQMLIVVGSTALLFQLQWGSPLAVLLLVVAAVWAASGWGMLLTAVTSSPGQVSALGSAVMLTFGILGGSFISLDFMPGWFRTLAKITPNNWGVNGFATLANGGDLGAVRVNLIALLAMGALLFTVAVVILNRRGLMKR